MGRRGLPARVLHAVLVVAFTAGTTAMFATAAPAANADPTPTAASCFTFDAGTGTINGYDAGDPACGSQSVVIPADIGGTAVTAIGTDAFENLSLGSVWIPASVTSIGDYAFYYDYIATLTFDKGSQLATIGDYAFFEDALTSVEIPASVTSIGDYAFYWNASPDSPDYSPSLGELTFAPESRLTSIGAHAFDSNGLATLDLTPAAGLTSIGDHAFGYNALASVSFPGSVTSIGPYAFSNNALTTISLPATVTSIGDWAFDTNDLTGTVQLPLSLTSLGANAFTTNEITAAIRHPWLDETTVQAAFDAGVDIQTDTDTTIGPGDYSASATSVTIPDGVTAIEANAFASGQLAAPLNIPASVTSIGADAFQGNQIPSLSFDTSSTQAITIGAGAFADNAISGTLSLPDQVQLQAPAAPDEPASDRETQLLGATTLRHTPDDVDQSPACTAGGTDGSRVTAQDGVGAFEGNDITDVVIPADVTLIPDQAFYKDDITSLTFASGRTQGVAIGVYAFASNQIAGAVDLPDDVTWASSDPTTTVPGYAAFDNNDITSLDLGTGITCLPDFAFEDNHIAGDQQIPDSVTTIGLQAFNENLISSVTIPASVTHIGYFGFGNNCLGDTSTTPGDTTCTGTQGGSGVTFTDGASSLQLDTSAFDSNDLASVALPATTPTTMDGYVFHGNARLTSADLSNTVGVLGKNVFSDDDLQGTLTIPAGITLIGDAAFARNELTGVTFSAGSALTTINQYAFDKNSIAGAVTLPDSVTSIGYMAFFANEITSATVPNTLTATDIGSAAFSLQTSGDGKTLTDEMDQTLADPTNTTACTEVATAMGTIFYTKLYTVDSSGTVDNAAGLTDESSTENSQSDYEGDLDCTGHSDKRIGGYIADPVQATFHYQDENHNTIRADDSFVGQFSDGTGLTDYLAAAAPAGSFFRRGASLSYVAPAIRGFLAPSAAATRYTLGATNSFTLHYTSGSTGTDSTGSPSPSPSTSPSPSPSPSTPHSPGGPSSSSVPPSSPSSASHTAPGPTPPATSSSSTVPAPSPANPTTGSSPSTGPSSAAGNDDDGVPGSVEAGAPNGGDGNGDGIPDYDQANVVSLPDATKSPLGAQHAYTTLVAPSGCQLSDVSTQAQPPSHPDPGYSYPAGLLNYTAACGKPGLTFTVTLYVYDLAEGQAAPRKYDAATGHYDTVPNATTRRTTIGGKSVTVVTYPITDGGPLDSDGTRNGVVVDPVGLALAAASAPTPAPAPATPGAAAAEHGGTSWVMLGWIIALCLVIGGIGGFLWLAARRRDREDEEPADPADPPDPAP